MKSKHFIAFLFLNSLVQPVQGFIQQQKIPTTPAELADGFFLMRDAVYLNGSESEEDADNSSKADNDENSNALAPQPNSPTMVDGSTQTDISDNNHVTDQSTQTNTDTVPGKVDMGTQTEDLHTHEDAKSHEPLRLSYFLCNKKRVLYAGGAFGIGAASMALFKIIHSRWRFYRINRVLKQYGKSLTTITAAQAKLMVAAYDQESLVIQNWIDQNGAEISSSEKWMISAICDLYLGKTGAQKTVKLT